MEQFRGVAIAYYNRSSAEDQKLARQAFGVLDLDGNGRVSLAEFKKVIGSDDSNNEVFTKYDQNGDGILDFEEFLTLYYTAKVGMRSCDGCTKWPLASYFSCVLCEKNFPKTYDLCCACYSGGTFRHHHSTDNFLDDRSMRLLFVHFLKEVNNITRVAPPLVQHSSSRNVKKAFEGLATAASIGNSVYKIGDIAVQAGCIIM